MPTTAARAALRLRKSSARRAPRRPSPVRSIRPRSAPALRSLPASPDLRRPVPSISGRRQFDQRLLGPSPLRHRQHPHRDLHHDGPDHRHAQHRRQLSGRCQQRRLEQHSGCASRRLREHRDDASPARSIRPRSAPASPSLPASPDQRRPVPSISATAGLRSAAARLEPSPAPATPEPRPAPRRA